MRRAAEKGIIGRRVAKPCKRLVQDNQDDDSIFLMELDTWYNYCHQVEPHSSTEMCCLENRLCELTMGQAEQSENANNNITGLDLENLFKDLSIRVDQAEQWEVKEHMWLEKIELGNICSAENTVDKTAWFGYGEEWQAHEDIDGMIKFQELSLHIDQSEKIPVPTQAGTPGCAAVGGGHIIGCPDGWGGRLYPSVTNRGKAPTPL